MHDPRVRGRRWVPAAVEARVAAVAGEVARGSSADVAALVSQLVVANDRIDATCINLNPATNVMNPRAEALLSSSMGMRPSLGYPGEKYETGLEAIEQVEIVAAELAAEVFDADFAEVRVTSGAMANLTAFMACAQPGDAVIVPPPSIGGHITHQPGGAAGLYGLDIHFAPVDVDGFTVDVDGLAELARRVQPKVISIGGSLNLFHHPVAGIREVADAVGAKVLFDAAHLGGVIAGGAWPNPLREGAHVMTGSTYKSLGGPPSGVLLSVDAVIAERVDAIVYPGLTANFDASSVAALAMSLLDWRDHGAAYAAEMCASALALAEALVAEGVEVYAADRGCTVSHQLVVDCRPRSGGDATARHLRRANLLASGIGIPVDSSDPMPGLRLGTPEIVRRGMATADMPELAALLASALSTDAPESVAGDVTRFRQRFTDLAFITT